MSFLTIQDPSKRDLIVDEFLKTKRNIQQNVLEEKLGDIGLQRELTKLYKPITDSQSGLYSQLSAIKEASDKASTALRALPSTLSTQLKAITFPQYPSIEAYQEPIESIRTLELGDLATKYLQQYASNKKAVDITFGIYSKDGQFFIGKTPITIQGDDVTVGDETYVGTPGLWELLTLSNPDKTIYNDQDFLNYAYILDKTDAIRQPKNPAKPKSSRSPKYNAVIKPIWRMIHNGELRGAKSQVGSGVGGIILPSDPNALVEMLPLRLAGIRAGNTGAISEATAISDELLRQGVITKDEYKAIMLQISPA